MFNHFDDPAPDTILHLAKVFRADPRPHKIDLGVGVFRDDAGITPVMRSVKAAEARLLAEQTSKSYLAPEGDMRFVELLAPLVMGPDLAGSSRIQGLQTPGGTGALKVALDLVKRASPNARLWLSAPTWPNHRPIAIGAGLEVLTHPFFDQPGQALLFDDMLATLETARPGDVVLLQACCHNPTGVRIGAPQWSAITDLMMRKDLIPLIDLAYQGLGDGLDDDAAPVRMLMSRLPEALLAYSCDKNFGLYRERTGALWIQGETAQAAARARAQALGIVRAIWSMPPDHGAAIVRTVLEDDSLRADWHVELDSMRARIVRLRAAVAVSRNSLGFLAEQTGMFSLLPTSLEQVTQLRDDHAIYVVPPGRINIAGLLDSQVETLAAALTGG